MRTVKIVCVSLILAVGAIAITVNSWYDRNIRVTFYAQSAKDIQYQVFYTSERDGKWQAVTQQVPAGKSNVKIVLPIQNIALFRLDFGSYPQTVYVTDLKVTGNKSVDILADDEDNYRFYQIDEHQFMNGKGLRISSNQNDPFMFYKEQLDVTPGPDINWGRLVEIGLGTFFVVLFLGLFLTRKKSPKVEEAKPSDKVVSEKSSKNSKTKK